MNKLLIIPLAIMLMLTIYGMVYTDSSITASSEDLNVGSGGVNGTTVDVPGAGAQTFNLDSSATVLAILIAAIAVGIAAGVNILGSGLSDTAQDIIFNSVLFFGIWAVLTAFASNVIFVDSIMITIYVVLTIIFTIGLGMQIGSRGAST